MSMTPQEAEAVGILIGNRHAWDTFIGYIDRLLNFERDKCVDVDKERVPIHQGRAKAFRQIVDIESEAEKIYRTNR